MEKVSISEGELTELCHRAKETASSNSLEDRLYALIILLRERAGDPDPGELQSSNPSFKERCEEALNDLFKGVYEADFRVTRVLNAELLNDASFTEMYKGHVFEVRPQGNQWTYGEINPSIENQEPRLGDSYPDKETATAEARRAIDGMVD